MIGPLSHVVSTAQNGVATFGKLGNSLGEGPRPRTFPWLSIAFTRVGS